MSKKEEEKKQPIHSFADAHEAATTKESSLSEEERALVRYGLAQGLNEKAVIATIVDERLKSTRGVDDFADALEASIGEKPSKKKPSAKEKLDEQYISSR